MCGRFNNAIQKMPDWKELLDEWPTINEGFNVAPTSDIAAFRSAKGEAMHWGIIPKWSKEFKPAYSTFNARVETIDEKPTFRTAWKNAQRCLIPIAGYYEWSGEKGDKQPYYVTSKDSTGLVLAGLFDSWKLNKFLSCTIITKPADHQTIKLHNRVPIALTPETALEWMNCRDNIDKDKVKVFSGPELHYYPVSKAVNSSLNNRKSLIEKIDI